MISLTSDENRWANDIGHRIIEVCKADTFDVNTLVEECESYASDNSLSEPFRECMAHAAQFLKIAKKYKDVNVLNCAELAVYGTMYDNWYK